MIAAGLRPYFVHFSANDDAAKLTATLRSALDRLAAKLVAR